MKLSPEPVHIERGEGALLIGRDKKEYIDAISSWWVNIHGHGNTYIAKRIAEQAARLEQVIFAGFTHTPSEDLASKLLEILPGKYDKVFYSDNGSTAVEVAIKMAFQYWHNKREKTRTKLVAFENAYHGDTFGAMSAGARSVFNAPFSEQMFDVVRLPVPGEGNHEKIAHQFNEILSRNDVAAFIYEPLVQGAGGMLMYDALHLDKLLSIAQQQGVICIADEVLTGFGRTGELFAGVLNKNQGDLICLSKGLTGGFLPLGVTVCTKAIFEAFYSEDQSKTFFHGHSFTANPIACAAALASIELLLDVNCLKQIRRIVETHGIFARELNHFKLVRKVRQTGTILAFNIGGDNDYFDKRRDEIYNFCLERGVLLRPLGNVLYIMPPYCITQVELEKVYNVIRQLIEHLEQKTT